MGLKQNDLRDMVYDIVGIDEYSSKMGENEKIITISFEVKTADPAEDLSNFLEKGYDYILDSDVSPGETAAGDYIVFVEIKRDRESPDHIMEILEDVKKLCGVEQFKFRYYKRFRSIPATLENIEQFVPTDPDNYGIVMDRLHDDNYSSFFDKSFAESVSMRGDHLIITKRFGNPMVFEVIDFGSADVIAPMITESFDIMESYPEILYLTKSIGEYHISKYGDRLVFENRGNLLVTRRIQ